MLIRGVELVPASFGYPVLPTELQDYKLGSIMTASQPSVCLLAGISLPNKWDKDYK
jgi:hypothetical protein